MNKIDEELNLAQEIAEHNDEILLHDEEQKNDGGDIKEGDAVDNGDLNHLI